MDTSVGLSSIASLSLGLSMSMTGAGRQVIKNLSTAAPPPSSSTSANDRRMSLSAHQRYPIMTAPCGPGPPASRSRRTSFVGILHQMSTQNRLLERSSVDLKMMQVVEEDAEALSDHGTVDTGSMTDSQIQDAENVQLDEMNNSDSHMEDGCKERTIIPDVIIHAAEATSVESEGRNDSSSVNSSDRDRGGGANTLSCSNVSQESLQPPEGDPIVSSNSDEEYTMSVDPPVTLKSNSYSLPQLSLRRLESNSSTRRPTNLSLSSLCRPAAGTHRHRTKNSDSSLLATVTVQPNNRSKTHKSSALHELSPSNSGTDPNCIKQSIHSTEVIATLASPEFSEDLIGKTESNTSVYGNYLNNDNLIVTTPFSADSATPTLETSNLVGIQMTVTLPSREEVDKLRNQSVSNSELTKLPNSSKHCSQGDFSANPVVPEFKGGGGGGGTTRAHKKGSSGRRGKLETNISVASDNGNVRSDTDRDILRSAQSMQAVCDSNSNTDIRQYIQEQSGADGRLTVCGEWYGRPLANKYERRGSSEAIRTTTMFSRSQESSPRGPSIGRIAWSKSQDISSTGDTNEAWSKSQEIHPKAAYHGNRRKSAHCIGLHSDRVSPNQM